MEFRLLGPLEVRDGARVLALGGPRQRALLAILLLRANQVMPAEELVGELWPTTAPETAGNTLQAHISRLRKAIGRSRIETQAPGYLLRLASGERDVELFDRLAADGRNALASGDAGRAADTLREALSLWRGPALADLRLDGLARAEVRRLDEARLTAIEERVEADLAVGRHAELVAELELLVAQLPLRERLRGQLMLALYRCGRQADALEQYRAARKLLVEELGIEPSPALQRLETAILLHDPSLDVGQPQVAEVPLAADRELATRRAPRLDVPVVGRDAELAHLRQALESVRARQTCHLVSVVGDPGIGKSRVAQELIAESRGEAFGVVGRCLTQGDGTAFWPLVEIVNQLAGECTSDAIERLLEGEDQGRLIADRIAGAIRGGPNAGEIEDTFWALRKLLEAIARRRPLLVVLEDVHWANETLLDFVDYVTDWSRDAPMLILCLARPELLDKRPTWGGGKLNVTALALEPLAPDDVRELLRLQPGVETLREADTARIVEVAEGNPLFVEQMAALADEHEEGELRIPSTINAILTARLANLSEPERAVLERASVIGKEFWLAAVIELSDDADNRAVLTTMRRLIRKGLVRPDRSLIAGEEGFRFHHGLIRDTAYASITVEDRAGLHERFANWFEARIGEQTPEGEEIVGSHLERAFRYKEQLRPLTETDGQLAIRAAWALSGVRRREMNTSGLLARVSLLNRAINLIPAENRLKAEIATDLASDLELAGDLKLADSYYHDALMVARGLGEQALEAYVGFRRRHLQLKSQTGPTIEALIAEGSDLAALFTLRGEVDYATPVRAVLASLELSRGAAGTAEALLEVVVRETHHRRDTNRLLNMARRILVAAWLWGTKPVPQAIEACNGILESDPPLRVAASAYRSLAVLTAMRGDFDGARWYLDRDGSILNELGLVPAAAAMRTFGAMVELFAGRPEAAESILRGALTTLQEMSERWYLADVMAVLAQAVYEQGRRDEAWKLTETCKEMSTQDISATIRNLSVRARIQAQRSEPEAARLAQTVVELANATDHVDEQGNAYLALADVQAALGGRVHARKAAHRAEALFERKGNLTSAAHAGEVLTRLSVGSEGDLP